jgi:hypothetical protein
MYYILSFEVVGSAWLRNAKYNIDMQTMEHMLVDVGMQRSQGGIFIIT